jgi:hypothetical protein
MQLLFTVLILFVFSLPSCLCSSTPIPKAEADAYTFKALTRFCSRNNCNASDFEVYQAMERVEVGNSGGEYLAWLYHYKNRTANGVEQIVTIMLDYCGGTEISSSGFERK